MLYKVKLKNAENKFVLLSEREYRYFTETEYFTQIQFLSHLRLHSSGYAFFQKNYPLEDETYKNVTIYVHKACAQRFLAKPDSTKKLFVRLKNGNPLDCRIENLEWVEMSELRRYQKNTTNLTGYRGVVKVSKNRYRAVLYNQKKRIDLGLYGSATDAAEAYNKKSEELFGNTKSLNKLGS
ncbi:MAG: hypothetical protein M9958_05065 [Chitinophagales bacterium]|nr:hypothetical protein [Chitinophagales bacterium]